VRKISFLLALVLTLAVAGVAAAADVVISVNDLGADSVDTIKVLFGSPGVTFDAGGGDKIVINGSGTLTKGHFEKIRQAINELGIPDNDPGTIGGPWLLGTDGYTVDLTGITDDNVIPAGAFQDDKWIQTVDFGNKITAIEANAFTQARSFVTLNITSTSLKKIAANAFRDSFLTTVTTFGAVEEIGENAFYGSSQLIDISAWGSVKKIGASAFKRAGLSGTIVAMPARNFEIGEEAFANSNLGTLSMAAITLPGDKLPNGIFKEMKSAAFSATLPTSIKIIGANAFYKANNAAAATLTVNWAALASLKTIEDGAFQDSGLGSVLIPNSLETIGKNAFNGSKVAGVTALTFSSLTNSNLKTIGEGAFKKTDLSSLSATPAGLLALIGAGTTGLELPKTVTEIGADAFNGTKLAALQIDRLAPTPADAEKFLENLPKIGKDALRGNPDLVDVTSAPAGVLMVIEYLDAAGVVEDDITFADAVHNWFNDVAADANTKKIVSYLYNAGFSARRVVDITYLTDNVVDDIVFALPTAGEDKDKEDEEEGKPADDEGKTGGSGGGGCATGAVLPFAAMLALGLVKRKSGR
jgi:hypothetical protein